MPPAETTTSTGGYDDLDGALTNPSDFLFSNTTGTTGGYDDLDGALTNITNTTGGGTTALESEDFAIPGTAQAAYATSTTPGGKDPYDPRTILPTSEQIALLEGTAQEPVDVTQSPLGTTTDIPVIEKDLFEIGLTDYTPALIGSGLESGVSAVLDTGQDLGLVGERVVNPEFVTNAAGIDDRSGLDRLIDELYVNRTGDTSIYDKFTVPVTLPVATGKTALENVLSNYSAGQYQEMADNISKLPQETKDALSSDILNFPQKYGYEEGQVDPGFASALGESKDKTNFAGVNTDALLANLALSSPGAVATVLTSMANLPAGMALGSTMAMGEGQSSANEVIDAAFADGSIQYNPEYQTVLSNSMNDPAFAALSDAEKNARVKNTLENKVAQGLIPLAALGAATTALTPGFLLGKNLKAGIATQWWLGSLRRRFS